MSDSHPIPLLPASPPRCPICRGETFLAPMHRAVEKTTSVFRCKRCGVDYPVMRPDAEDASGKPRLP